MRQNKDTAVPINSIIINYVAILALIPLVATLIGDIWAYSLSFYGLFGYGLYGYAFGLAILSYILDIIGIFVLGLLIWKLSPSFGTTTDQARATLLAAFVVTPFFLASILEIIPVFGGLLAFLGLLYGLYILYLGLPIMLGTPADKVLIYVVVTVVVTFVIFVVIGAIIGAIAAAIFFARILVP
jgi:hypothetical protein